jgi:DUF1016 N-terminal domain
MSKLRKPVPLYEDIRALVLSARQTIAHGVDLLQVHTNYEIGRRIVNQEQHGQDRAEYGKELLADLSARLTGEFGNGFVRQRACEDPAFFRWRGLLAPYEQNLYKCLVKRYVVP